MMNQLKSIYNSPFKSSHSHPIHTCLATIASNEQCICVRGIRVEINRVRPRSCDCLSQDVDMDRPFYYGG